MAGAKLVTDKKSSQAMRKLGIYGRFELYTGVGGSCVDVARRLLCVTSSLVRRQVESQG